MKNINHTVSKILLTIVIIVLAPIIFYESVIIIDSYVHPDEVPSFFGWKPFIVMSGSMETNIMTGDLVVVKETNLDTLKEWDIIAFKEGKIVITHRIVDIYEENNEIRYITKGDNNNTEDKGYVTNSQIEGLYQFKIPRLGNLAMFVQTPIGCVVAISIPLLLLLLIQLIYSKKEQKNIKAKDDKEKLMEEEIRRLKEENKKLQNKDEM